MSTKIAPSILSADFTNLENECRDVLEAGADWLHIDVMDGAFVPNITIGLPVVESLRERFPEAFLDVHLMIDDPETYSPQFCEAGADLVSFHAEATPHAHRIIQKIHEKGVKAGLAINPATSLDTAEYLLGDLELLLIMGVNPGFSGQSFIPEIYQKLRNANRRIDSHSESGTKIELDGGVSPNNIEAIYEAGADIFVSGSGVFGAEDYQQRIHTMRENL